VGLILIVGSSGEVSLIANVCPSAWSPGLVGRLRNAGSAWVVAELRCEARGAAMAAGRLMPKSKRLTRICNTVVMIDAPPGEPTASSGRPPGEFVVEQEAAPGHDDAAAAELLDRIRVGDHVAVTVGDHEVTRVRALLAGSGAGLGGKAAAGAGEGIAGRNRARQRMGRIDQARPLPREGVR
jgi:hypothetical protein